MRSLRAQTSKDFTLILLLGDDFPEPWRARMLANIADVPQVRPVFHPAGDHREVYRTIMTDARDRRIPMVAEFVADDDDSISLNFVERLHDSLPLVRPLATTQQRVALDFKRGLGVTPRPDRIDYLPVVAPFRGCALAVYRPCRSPRSIMDISHHKLWYQMPSLGLVDETMFLLGSHATNDSNIITKGCGRFHLADDALTGLLESRFAIPPGAPEAAWAALQNRLCRHANQRLGAC